MLKLVAKDGSKNFWLVGESMHIGQARKNEIPISGQGVGDVHGCFFIEPDSVSFQSNTGEVSYINETKLMGKKILSVGDVLRIGGHEFTLKDSLAKSLDHLDKQKQNIEDMPKNKINLGEDSTVFRDVDVPKASGWLLQALHPSLKNKRYPIDGTLIVGRSKDCDLFFASDRLSRQHAQLKVLDGNLFFKDLASSNGIFHNGLKVSQAKLLNGDTIALDKLEFSVIAPKTSHLNLASDAETDNNDLTVVRAAITPDMIRKAQQSAKQANNQEQSPTPENNISVGVGSPSNALMIACSIVIGLAIIAATVLLV
jgi:pSer/pThr/pTyr-binding forkhead associated (FHA) protein